MSSTQQQGIGLVENGGPGTHPETLMMESNGL
jgi:hypothetical protein